MTALGQERSFAQCPLCAKSGHSWLENYYLPGDVESEIAAFVAAYSHRRYQETLADLTPADGPRPSDPHPTGKDHFLPQR